MQMKCYWLPFIRTESRRLSKICMVMRLTALLLTAAFVHAHATGSAQNISLSGKNLSLEQVFTAIEKQTGYVVLGNKSLFSGAATVSLEASNMPLRDLLDMVFKERPIEYVIKGKTIVLSGKSRTPVMWMKEQPIKGIIRDQNGVPLAGASVSRKGAKTSTISDKDGRFTINADIGDELVITYVGFVSRAVAVTAADMGPITLEASETALNEVTVNAGYYVTKERLRTGSISKVTSKEIANQPVTSPLMALQGRLPGVNVRTPTGVYGQAPEVRIRGYNSIRYEGDAGLPLYVVDGVVMDSRPMQSNSSVLLAGFDPLGTINAENIESIEVLKDADATAIYGSRGANGVILITTKSGSPGKVAFDMNIYQGGSSPAGRLKLLHTEDYLAMREEAFRNAGQTPDASTAPDLLLWDRNKYTDWQKAIFKTAGVTDVQANISGGSRQVNFRIGGAYHREGSIVKGDFDYRKYNVQFDLGYRSVNDRLHANFKALYGSTNSTLYELYGLFPSIVYLPPNMPDLYNPDGSINWGLDESGTYTLYYNPVRHLQNSNDAKTKTLNVSASINYRIANGLYLRTNMGYTDLNSSEYLKFPIKTQDPANRPYYTGSANLGTNDRATWMVEPVLSYTRQYGDHTLDVLVGTTFQDQYGEETRIEASGFSSDALLNSLRNAPRSRVIADNNRRYRYSAIYGRIGYNYREKYLLNLTGRRDGSSRFGDNNKFGNFGAIGAAWIISEEKFVKEHLRFLSFAKLRTSHGITGSDQIGDYKFYRTYQTAFFPYNNIATLIPTALYNPAFQWERTTKQELALHLGFIHNRITTEMSYYRHKTGNQLIDYMLPEITGFSSILRNMPAIIQNTGLEVLINTRNIERKDFTWQSSLNLSIPREKLVRFDGIERTSYDMYNVVGEPPSIDKVYNLIGIDPQTGLYQFEDVNKDGVFDIADQTAIRNRSTVLHGGLSNNFRYKGFTLDFLLYFGQRVVSGYEYTLPGQMGNIRQTDYDNRWQKPGDIATYPVVTTSYDNYTNWEMHVFSTGYYPSVSFLRLKSAELGYNLPDAMLRRIHLSAARIFLQGYNLLTFSNQEIIDPETGNFHSPPLRNITIGLNIKL